MTIQLQKENSILTNEKRSAENPLRRPKDYNNDGTRRRKWSRAERKYRLSYRRRPVTTAVSTAAAIVASATIAYSGSQVSSIFAGTELDGSGWTICDGPISWTLDSGIPYEYDLKWAFAEWEKSGYKFIYAGPAQTTYDDANSRLTTVAEINRNIAISFLPDRASTMLTQNVAGFAGPSSVLTDKKKIVGSYIVFNLDYALSASQKQRRALFLHEIGHALGLADSQDKNNVMYWTVDSNTHLSEGEVKSVALLEKNCD